MNGDLEDSKIPLEFRERNIRMLAWFPRNKKALLLAENLKTAVAALPSTGKKESLLKVIDDYLEVGGSLEISPEKRRQLCIACITGTPEADPEMTEEMAWYMLSVPGKSEGEDPKIWKEMIAPAAERLKADNPSYSAKRLLAAGWIVDSLVDDTTLKNWLTQDESEELFFIAAKALVRRSKISELVEFAWKQPGFLKVKILEILVYGGKDAYDPDRKARSPDYEAKENVFWEYCARRMPVDTAVALWTGHDRGSENPFNRIIHDPLQDFFSQVAESGGTEKKFGHKEADRLRLALEMLSSWQLSEDDGIIVALLEHKAWVEEVSYVSGWSKIVNKRYFLREAAKQALMKRGKPVPKGVVLKSELPASGNSLDE